MSFNKPGKPGVGVLRGLICDNSDSLSFTSRNLIHPAAWLHKIQHKNTKKQADRNFSLNKQKINYHHFFFKEFMPISAV